MEELREGRKRGLLVKGLEEMGVKVKEVLVVRPAMEDGVYTEEANTDCGGSYP